MDNRRSGSLIESKYSKIIHPNGVPVLISSHYLRVNGCGQVDICLLSKFGSLEVFEIKKGINISIAQSQRLLRSAKLLQSITGKDVRCFVCFHRCGEIFPLF